VPGAVHRSITSENQPQHGLLLSVIPRKTGIKHGKKQDENTVTQSEHDNICEATENIALTQSFLVLFCHDFIFFN
jgi:hypothetical protein